MPELNPKHVQAVLKLINQGPYFKHLSMPIQDIGQGYSLVELNIGREHLNALGGLHGGVYASAIDTAAYWSVYCELAEDAGLVSIDLKVDFLGSISTGKLIIKGHSIKIGKTMCLAEATVFDQQDKYLAHGTSKMMVIQGSRTMQDRFHAGDAHLPPKFIEST